MMANWTREPIKAAEAAAGIRAIGFIGLHDLSPKELSNLAALIGKLETMTKCVCARCAKYDGCPNAAPEPGPRRAGVPPG